MNGTIDIEPAHLELVCSILSRSLPPGSRVWAFGSRATRMSRPYSDLDLAIDAGVPMAESDLLTLSEELEDSSLPYKVDLVDWQTIDERFRRLVKRDRVLVYSTAAGSVKLGPELDPSSSSSARPPGSTKPAARRS